jgi:hypothetical protein
MVVDELVSMIKKALNEKKPSTTESKLIAKIQEKKDCNK